MFSIDWTAVEQSLMIMGKGMLGIFIVTAIIVVLVIVWIFAIAAVCIIVHIKRSGIKLSENGEIEKPRNVPSIPSPIKVSEIK